MLQGAFFTTPTEQSTILANNTCPVAAAAPAPDPVTPLKLLILGDTNTSLVTTAITTRLTDLGYTDATVSSAQLGTSYTGSTIDTATYNVVFIFTNSSQTGGAGLNTNLTNFVTAGGNVVSATFIWSLYPSGFTGSDFTPFGLKAQSSDSTGNMTVDVVHPITTGVTTTLTGGSTSIFNNGNVTLQTGTTKIASFTTSGVPLVGIRTIGSSRVVGLNIQVNTLSSYPNLRNLVTNAILWANSII